MKNLLLGLIIFNNFLFALNFDQSRHLLNRTGFGATYTEIKSLGGLSRNLAVSLVLSGIRSEPVLDLPSWKDKSLDKKAQNELRKEWAQELKEWWAGEILITNSPLTEKMVLFWHDHFATALQKVRWPQLMLRQNLMFRKHALGNFETLLNAMLHDAALLFYLDAQQSKKQAPNENFARELLELFTMGIGNYTEKDVLELARALTGLKIDNNNGSVVFKPGAHDGGTKTILGQKQRFRPADIAQFLVSRTETKRFIVNKLWSLMIDLPLPPEKEQSLLKIMVLNKNQLKPVMEAILLSDEFWHEKNRASRIKGPVDHILGFLRTIEYLPEELQPVVQALRRTGQDLFDPPSVKGWSEGNLWLNTASMQQRIQIQKRFLRGMDSLPNLQKLEAGAGSDLAKVLLPLPPLKRIRGTTTEKFNQLLAEPGFQLY
ncbi:MAG: DUF1800 domain-containing protein [Candidatus Cloacimonetes bacterium]|nr:DUF1800 domain-containing protein [Candidatus Cloacimonadota bacterium]